MATCRRRTSWTSMTCYRRNEQHLDTIVLIFVSVLRSLQHSLLRMKRQAQKQISRASASIESLNPDDFFWQEALWNILDRRWRRASFPFMQYRWTDGECDDASNSCCRCFGKMRCDGSGRILLCQRPEDSKRIPSSLSASHFWQRSCGWDCGLAVAEVVAWIPNQEVLASTHQTFGLWC